MLQGCKTVLFLSALALAGPAAAAERTIDADMAAPAAARDMFWQDCVGADHPGILLRPENLSQLGLVRDAVGFKYIRFHGIFADDMHVYREVAGKPVYDFSAVDAVYDAIVKIGMKPFVELSFMPHDLASSERTLFYWKGNGSPPKDYAKWGGLIDAFVRHLEARYGKTEVASWRFEVWNEPNLDIFWYGASQDAYFRLYDVTAKAIKAVDPALKVGGPSTAGAAWVPEFLAHAAKAKVPVDFVTTHTYGVNRGFVDEKGESDTMLAPEPSSIVGDMANVRREVNAAGRPDLPVYFTEWNSSYSPRDPVHDTYLNAAFVLEKLKRAEGTVQSMSYWTYTDLFEESGPPPTPFHGGFGLINREGIPKATYFAYKYLADLGPAVLPDADAHSWLTRRGDDFAALMWDFVTPKQTESDRPYFRKRHPATAAEPAKLTVKGLKPGRYRLTVRRTGFMANDAYSQYIAWGLPETLSERQIAELKAMASDRPETDESVTVGKDGIFRRPVALRTNDCVFVSLSRLRQAD